ncbi:MAG: hypothetical protein BM556_13880 [Bacteriovorax sp. MedPE-SWde]|nr:MAG: hypothetical protein BM556_13880 [Bacteriovorax sp. MedPE-SWde]
MKSEQLIEIQSEFISAKISPLGAEIKSLTDLESGVEYLWQGKKAVYPWSSQVIFPIVGKLREDQYFLGRKYYRLAKDGFAKDLKFDVKSQRKDQVSFILTHDADTMLGFPYMFSLIVTYSVYGPKLSVSVEIKNLDKKEMFCSLGFATIFNLPISDEGREDYYLEFNNEEDRGSYYLDNELVNFHHADDKKVMIGNSVSFKDDTFKGGEMLFKDFSSNKVTYKNRVNEKSVELEFGNVPYLSVWSYPDAPFVRIAPSFGVTDAVDSNNDFYMKEGLIDIEQEKTFKFEMSIMIR